MRYQKLFMAAAFAMLAAGSAPAWAAGPPRGAPAPVAATGLSFLLAAGALGLRKRRRIR